MRCVHYPLLDLQVTAASRRRAGSSQGAVDGLSRICDSPATHPGTPGGPSSAVHSRACGPRILGIHSSSCRPSWRRGPRTHALFGMREPTAQSVDLDEQRPCHPDLVEHVHDRERRYERDGEEDGPRRRWRVETDRQQAESKLEDSQRHPAPESKGPPRLAPFAQPVEKPRSPSPANSLRPIRRTRVTTHGLSLVARPPLWHRRAAELATTTLEQPRTQAAKQHACSPWNWGAGRGDHELGG